MGVLTFLSNSSVAETKPTIINEKQQTASPPSQEVSQVQMTPPTDTSSNTSSEDASHLSPPSPEDIPLPPAITSEQKEAAAKLKRPTDARRFSFRSFSFVNLNEQVENKPALSTIQDHEKKAQASAAFSKRLARPMSTSSDRRAKESALIVRSLIVGPTGSAATPQTTRAVAKPQLSKVKSQLMQPKSANKVIAQLRALPATDASTIGKDGKKVAVTPASKGPIHAVCLAFTDAEEHELHFAQLLKSPTEEALEVSGIAAVSIETLTSLFKEMHIVNLMTAPNFGLGEPGDGAGILAGAVPTAETIIDGIQQITPQLMALGYATGKAVLPDHTGVYPPKDRMSVLTYWWGLELVLPPPSLKYLSNEKSISGAVINFLTALSVIDNGVREILPFVRYISQFLDFEFSAIQKQDKGKGVVCAATWIMPAAMVPRPWDFPEPVNEAEQTPPIVTEAISADHPLPSLIITAPTASIDSVASETNATITVSA